MLGTLLCGCSLLYKKQPTRNYPAYHLACALEDAPETSLTGQKYELATPLMSPFACIVVQSWQHFYRENLKKPHIHYWSWLNLPESAWICPEISLLFTLPVPQGYAKEVLEVLAKKTNPFLKPPLDKNNLGQFAYRDLKIQQRMRQSFKQWHRTAQKQIGFQNLKAIYQRCYGISWTMVEQIITEQLPDSIPWWQLLGVHRRADNSQVEQAYKRLIRLWHPDLNNHPNATEITARINVAYEEYCKVSANRKFW